MQAEIIEDIQSNNRYEFLAVEAGQVKAMMVLYVDYDPHYGRVIYTRYAFSSEPQALTQGYRWMKQLAKSLNLDGFIITRQLAPNKIINNFKGLSNDQ